MKKLKLFAVALIGAVLLSHKSSARNIRSD